jgi:tetratricopeptide (TPR) repeat protein/serine phosphatase RsbU (regulator of sigma subunit)
MQKLYLFFIAIFIGFSSIAQVDLDSLWGVWNDHSNPDTNRLKAMHEIAMDGYFYSKPDSAFYFAQLQYEFAESVNNKKWMADALITQGASFYIKSNYAKAIDYYAKSLKIYKELEDQKSIAISLNNIGVIYETQGDYTKAIDYYTKSLKVYELVGDKKGVANSLNNIGSIHEDQGDNSKAIDDYTKSLKVYELVGDKKGIANTLNCIGIIYKNKGDYAKAIDYYTKSLKIHEEMEDENGIAISLNNIGVIYKKKGDYSKAIDYSTRSLKIYEEIGYNEGIANSLKVIGVIYKEKGDYTKAIDYSTKSLKIYQEIGDKKGIAITLENIGVIYIEKGDYAKAMDYHAKSLKIYENLEDKKGIAITLINIGLLYKEHKGFDKALEYYKRGLDISSKIGDKKGIAEALNAIGLICENQGKYNEALDYYNKTLTIQQEIGNLKGIANIYNNIGILYKEQKDYLKAMDYYLKSLKISEEIGGVRITSNILGNIGMLYFRLNNYQQAQKYSNRSLVLAKNVNALGNIEFNSNLLYEIYKKTHKDSKALEMLELYNDTKGALDKMNLNDLLLKEKVKQEYEVKIYKDSIANLINVNKLADRDAALQIKKDQQIMLFGGLGLVILFSFFIFNRYRITHKQKKVIQGQHQELEHNHNILEEAHKDITDSIVYAKRIQDATLTSTSYINDVLPQSFLYFNPKELVSGDFYWVFNNGDDVFFTVADCTGHGVPGAFMSMIGNSLLNEMIIENKIRDTNLIMDNVSNKIKISLDQKGEQGQSRDGMDMMLCRLNKKTNELMFTGAKNPLFLIRDGEVIEYKGDKRPIGYYLGENILFTSKKIKLKNNDMIYVFSDGFSDQFGGEKGKKYKAESFKRFLLTIVDKDMGAQQNLISEEFDLWKGDLEQLDDVCVMGVRV